MDFSRQSGILEDHRLEHLYILIVGAGSIGSFATLALAKMGIRHISVVDFDVLQDLNIPNQLFNVGDVGKKKVLALRDVIHAQTGVTIDVKDERFNERHLNWVAESGIVVAATDNMAVRKEMYEAMTKTGFGRKFVDARMAKLALKVLNIDPKVKGDRELYESHLHDDKDAVQLPCTERGIVFPVMTCAAMISRCIQSHVMEQRFPRFTAMDYTVPTLMVEN